MHSLLVAANPYSASIDGPVAVAEKQPLLSESVSKLIHCNVICTNYFKQDYFIPGGFSGVSVAGFPYTLSVIKSFKHFHLKSKLRREPFYLEFYKKNHPSRALATTVAILREFYHETIRRGKIPIVTIIPTGDDLLFFLEHRRWPYDSLIEALSQDGISVFNFGTGILKNINHRDPCSLFKHCSAHYNEEGYRILAMVAYEWLVSLKLFDN